MILYTSGTTGRPKGARITYGMALFNAVHATSSVALGVDSTNLVFLPTFHAAGLHLYANPIFQLGATNVVLRTFDPGRFLALLASKGIRITHLLGVPTNFLMMAQQPGFAEADLSHIVSIGVGGAAAPLALLETYAAKGVALQQLWGMTETCAGEGQSHCGVSGRRAGGGDRADPVFHPSNGEAHRNQSPVNSGRFTRRRCRDLLVLRCGNTGRRANR